MSFVAAGVDVRIDEALKACKRAANAINRALSAQEGGVCTSFARWHVGLISIPTAMTVMARHKRKASRA